MKARALAAVCANSNQDEHIDSMAEVTTPSKWRAPEGGWLKLNRDATLNSRSKKMGIGIVVQNKYGEFVAALAKVLPLVDDPTAAEAIAAWHVVSMCVNCGFQQIVLEGDSMVVVLALNQTMASWSSYGQLIEDTKEKVC
jgi:ribonuclease HI